MKRYSLLVDSIELGAFDVRGMAVRAFAELEQSDDKWDCDILLLDRTTNAVILHAQSERGAFGG